MRTGIPYRTGVVDFFLTFSFIVDTQLRTKNMINFLTKIMKKVIFPRKYSDFVIQTVHNFVLFTNMAWCLQSNHYEDCQCWKCASFGKVQFL